MNQLLATILLLAGTTLAHAAGDLEPTGAPAPTMHSLEEIYQAISAAPNPNETLPLPDLTVAQGSDFIHMRASGETQGELKGSCTVAGREDTIVVAHIAHSVISPRDAASGLPTGKRQHSPLKVTVRIDRATPLLFKALVNNENLTTIELQFWTRSDTGRPMQYFTIQLINASISGIRMGTRDQMEINLVYQKIIWTWVDGGISAEDDWEAPVS